MRERQRADEGLARAELEARIAPRTLRLSEREWIGKELRRFAFSFFGRKVKIHWQPNDLEAAVFGVEIRDALLRASIPVETDESLIIGNTGYGVRMTGTGQDAAFINSLYVLLRANTGSAVSWEVNPRYFGLPVSIEVAAKPPLGLDTLGQMIPEPTSTQDGAPTQIPDRHLTREQQSATARQLRPFIGQGVSIVLYREDPETREIGVDIDAALNMAGWIRSSPSRSSASDKMRGVLIEVDRSATDRDRNAAEWLAIALRDDKLNVTGPLRSNRVERHQLAPITITIGKNQ
jgi:hypothetical protein